MTDQVEGISINLHEYNDLVAQGNINVQRLAPKTFQLILRRWNPSNGEEIEPGVVRINPAGLDISIKQLDEQIAQIQKARDNMQALKDKLDEMESNNESLFQATKQIIQE